VTPAIHSDPFAMNGAPATTTAGPPIIEDHGQGIEPTVVEYPRLAGDPTRLSVERTCMPMLADPEVGFRPGKVAA